MRQLRALSARRTAAIVAVAVLAAACDGYPSEWAGIAHPGFLPIGCPDLAGTWQLHPARGGRPYSQSVIEREVKNRQRQRWRWETVTIAGDARDSLMLTLRRRAESIAAYHDTMNLWGDREEREYRMQQTPEVRWRGSFARMTDSAYAENLAKLTLPAERQVALRRGTDYECAGGWLVGDRTVHDPGPDPRTPRPDTVIGVVRIARSRDDHLVFNAKFDESVEFSIWCGDGCRGIPLGEWEKDEWSRLGPTPPLPPFVLKRPWAEPFAPPPLAPANAAFAPLQSAAQVREELEEFVPAGARLLSVHRDASRYRALFALDSGPDAIRPMFEPLARSQRFPTATVIGVERDGAGSWTLALQLGLVSTGSATSPGAIEARLRALLPSGTSIERVRRSGPSFFIEMRFSSRASYSATLVALRAATEFAEPEVMQVEQQGQGLRAEFRLRERPGP